MVMAVAAAVSLAFSISGKKAVAEQQQAGSAAQQQDALVARIANAPDSPLAADNSEGAPLMIQSAGAKEISAADYQPLTGMKADATAYVTLPNLRLVNGANQNVKEFTLCLLHKYSNMKICIHQTSIDIAPGGAFNVEWMTWAGPRKAMMRKYADQAGRFQKDNSKPQLNSDAMWLPGGAADYSLIVGSVIFADGSKWITKR
jgi:hypothetical protein